MRLPPIGFGCSPFRANREPIDLTAALRAALEVGFRLIDLAELYGNERAIGETLAATRVSWSELFLVGKVWRTNFRPARLRAACEASLGRLGVDSFDLYLLHAPEAWAYQGPLLELGAAPLDRIRQLAFPVDPAGRPLADDVPLNETWGAMLELKRRGLVREIGVSNFAVGDLEKLADSPPAANQIEHHPYRRDLETVDYCQTRGIRLLVYSPLSAPGLLADPTITRLARDRGLSSAQVLLAWQHERGLVPIVNSTSAAHLRENFQSLDRRLDAEALEIIDRIAQKP